ncbi:hypothetical protein APUTEX25_005668, partial [Auxenochlorella protothecoides]
GLRATQTLRSTPNRLNSSSTSRSGIPSGRLPASDTQTRSHFEGESNTLNHGQEASPALREHARPPSYAPIQTLAMAERNLERARQMPGRQTCWVHATAASPSGQEVYSNFDQRLRAEEHVLTSSTASHTALHLVTEGTYEHWLREQPESRRAWLRGIGFDPKDRKMAHLPSLTPDSDRHEALVAIESMEGPWAVAGLPSTLPPGSYALRPGPGRQAPDWQATASLAWALERYSFLRYKDEAARKAATAPRRLVVPPSPAQEEAGLLAAAIYLVRDLINTPAEDLTPAHLAAEAEALAAEHPGASLSVVSGDALLHADSFFPMVHAVGRAAACPPHLLDLRWQPAPQIASLPLLVLVGKGVTFDSGGLNIKPAAGMRLMKKDMGGAALVLGLAHVIMQAQLPVRLRVLVPAVENAVGPASFRPGDVLRSRAGRSVEVGNTDAEGRLILADALAAAGEGAAGGAGAAPDLVLDAATLTGAARVALGAELPALFTDDEAAAAGLAAAAAATGDPLWRLPLHVPYAHALRSPVADLLSCPEGGGLGGAITAALFLKEFAPAESPWVHLDTMGWNLKPRPGRPEGGEALALRAIWAFLKARYGGADGGRGAEGGR